MTEQNQTGQCAQDRPALEITPAMIEAGVIEFFAVAVALVNDRGQGVMPDVQRIYKAMEEASRRQV